MKTAFYILFGLILAGTLAAQTPSEYSVSLRTPDGKFVGQTPNGGLDAESAAVTAKQLFVLVDLNGGQIADGDRLKFRFDASQWREDREKSVIHRVPSKIAKEEECIFKARVRDARVYLETATGKFVRIDGGALVTTGEIKNATGFEIQKAMPPNDPTAYAVALKFPSGGYLGMVGGGGLDAVSKEITKNEIFTMIDLNGGTLSNGDAVRLVYEQSQMREDVEAGRLHRVPIRGAKESECTFRIFVFDGGVRLRAPSGRWLAATADGKSVVTAEKPDAANLLTPVANPTPAQTKKGN